MFSFSYDAQRILLTVVQRGYWDMAEFRSYEREYLAQHSRIRLQHRNYRVIAECRDYPVQSAEVGIAFAALFDKLMNENKGHCAILTPSTLNKIQAKRAIPYANVQVFSDEQEAMDWLFVEGSLPD
jgi:hypothetical protein